MRELTCEEASEGRRLAEVRRGRGAGTTVSFCRPAWPQLAAELCGSGADRMLEAPTLSRLLCRVTPTLELAWAVAGGAPPGGPTAAVDPKARASGTYAGGWLFLMGLLVGAAPGAALLTEGAAAAGRSMEG